MSLWDHLFKTAAKMLREPRAAASDLVRADLSREVVLMAFFAIMAVSIIATEPLLSMAASMFEGEPLPPFRRALGSAIGGLAFVWVTWKLGGLLGGRGTFDQILLSFVFMEGILIVAIFGLLLLTFTIPAIAGMAGIAFICYWVWMYSNVVAEVHEFPSAWKALGVVALSMILVNYAGILIASLLFGASEGAVNV